jgi:hypothetical protein
VEIFFMQRIIALLAFYFFLQSGVFAQTPNRTPEQKAKDDKELAEFKKNYPQLFTNNRWPLTLEDGATYVDGYRTSIVLKGNTIVDSLQSNFHADMPDTTTVMPFTKVPVGGAEVHAFLADGIGIISIGGEASITPIDSMAMTMDTTFAAQMKANRHFLNYGDTTRAIRISLNGRVLLDWTPLGHFPRQLCEFRQNFIGKSAQHGYNFSYGFTYHLYDTTLAIHDQLVIEVKYIRKNWLMDSYNIIRTASSPALSSLVVPPSNEDGVAGNPVTFLSREKKTSD